MPDDIGSGAVQYLKTAPQLTSMLGSFAATDPVAANRGLPWIFKDDLMVGLQGSQQVALVCSAVGSWSAPVQYSTARFPRLAVTIYADPLRDVNGMITESSGGTKKRAAAVFTQLNYVLHRNDSAVVFLGDMITCSCELTAEPQWSPFQINPGDGDGMVQGTAYYAFSIFGFTDALG